MIKSWSFSVRAFFYVCTFLSLVSFCDRTRAEGTELVIIGEWHFNLGAGLGMATNPLHGGDHFPLILLPDLAYYGEQIYFDNGQLGYSLIETNHHVFNLVTELNPENKFFVFWQPLQTLSLSDLAQDTDIGSMQKEQPISIDKVSSRRWAIDAGLNYQYFNGPFSAQFNFFHDINNVYHGWRLGAEISYTKRFDSWIYNTQFGFWLKSQALNNYYYGINTEESGTQSESHIAKQGLHPFFSGHLIWPLSEDKSFHFKVTAEDYSAVSDSPLFKDDFAVSVFFGLKYAF